MKLDEFDMALLTYGPYLERWPPEMRAQAGDLLQHDDAARRLQAQMLATETRVIAAARLPANGALASRILARPGGAVAVRAPGRGTLAALGLSVIALPAVGYLAADLLFLILAAQLSPIGGVADGAFLLSGFVQ
ncbi:MAG TPA: hypothetical protein PKE65_09380 [Rhizobiaceae bacterium]|nr:hypothetical protein [Rhizobiaceae bacterium]